MTTDEIMFERRPGIRFCSNLRTSAAPPVTGWPWPTQPDSSLSQPEIKVTRKRLFSKATKRSQTCKLLSSCLSAPAPLTFYSTLHSLLHSTFSMAVLGGSTGRIAYVGFLTLSTLLLVAQLGVLSYIVDEVLSGHLKEVKGLNAASQYLIIFASVADIVGAVGWLVSLIHFVTKDSLTLLGSVILTLQSFAFFCLALGFGAKQSKLGGAGDNEDSLFGLVVALTVTQLIAFLIGLMAHDFSPKPVEGAGYDAKV
eukprot:jgi/Mesen1/10352/ME000008S10118